jgi:hypothetical protein
MLALIYSKRRNQAYVSIDEDDDFLLPVSRAKKSLFDYQIKKENWDTLLSRFLKTTNTNQKSIPPQTKKTKVDDGW